MNRVSDENGIEHVNHEGHLYYNRTNAARYVGLTDSGLRRKIKMLEEEHGIFLPLDILPVSRQKRFIDKRILDVFRKSIRVGQEEEWRQELRRAIHEVLHNSPSID